MSLYVFMAISIYEWQSQRDIFLIFSFTGYAMSDKWGLNHGLTSNEPLPTILRRLLPQEETPILVVNWKDGL